METVSPYNLIPSPEVQVLQATLPLHQSLQENVLSENVLKKSPCIVFSVILTLSETKGKNL